jgi:chromosome segregation ATPase
MFFRNSKKRDYEEEIRRLQAKLSDALWDQVTLRADIQELCEENSKLKSEKVESEKLFGNYPSTEDDLPFGAPDEYEKPEEDITYLTDRIEYLEEELEKLGDARQSDLITINQLQVALDVVLDKYERLRKQKGLV